MRRMMSQFMLTFLAGVAIFLNNSVWAASESEKAILERIQPIGKVCVAGADCGNNGQVAANSGVSGGDLEGTYNTYCSLCHSSGVAGAPIVGDEAAWQPRIARGLDAIVKTAINGINAMPPKGTCATCSDADIKDLVVYMVEKSGGAVESSSSAPEAAPATSAETASTTTTVAATKPAEAATDNNQAVAQTSYDLEAGKSTYNTYCMVCHATGAAGAPVLGDAAAWAPRIDKGMDVLISSTINGLNGVMPAKGLCMSCTDDDLANAVAYMVEESGGMKSVSAPDNSSATSEPAETAKPVVAEMVNEPAPEPVKAAYEPPPEAIKVYQAHCFTCHDTGAAGAPILKDKAAWAPRIAKGMDTLMNNTVNGLNVMPPKGLCFTCSDAELSAVVEYMVNVSQ